MKVSPIVYSALTPLTVSKNTVRYNYTEVAPDKTVSSSTLKEVFYTYQYTNGKLTLREVGKEIHSPTFKTVEV